MQRLNGFVKVHRKLVQWGWYQDYVVKDLFLHLLLTASFRESQWMGRTIEKGQVITSYAHLAEELGFSVKQIRTALNKLKSTGKNIKFWNLTRQANGQTKGKQRASRGQTKGNILRMLRIIKNVKK